MNQKDMKTKRDIARAVSAITESYEEKIFPGVGLSVEANEDPKPVIRVVMDPGHHSRMREVHVFEHTGHGDIHGAICGYSLVSRHIE